MRPLVRDRRRQRLTAAAASSSLLPLMLATTTSTSTPTAAYCHYHHYHHASTQKTLQQHQLGNKNRRRYLFLSDNNNMNDNNNNNDNNNSSESVSDNTSDHANFSSHTFPSFDFSNTASWEDYYASQQQQQQQLGGDADVIILKDSNNHNNQVATSAPVTMTMEWHSSIPMYTICHHIPVTASRCLLVGSGPSNLPTVIRNYRPHLYLVLQDSSRTCFDTIWRERYRHDAQMEFWCCNAMTDLVEFTSKSRRTKSMMDHSDDDDEGCGPEECDGQDRIVQHALGVVVVSNQQMNGRGSPIANNMRNNNVDENKNGVRAKPCRNNMSNKNAAALNPESHFYKKNGQSSIAPQDVICVAHDKLFDVVLDKGLMDAFLCGDDWNRTIRPLLQQASTILRPQMGIYLLVSYKLAPFTKEFLQDIGKDLGLVWEFGVEGSNDRVDVSIATKRE